MLKNYYRILQVDPKAEPEVITAAYKKLAQKYHPDHNRDANSSERMKQLNEAYDVLKDPERRLTYDIERKTFLATQRSSRRRPSTPQQSRQHTNDTWHTTEAQRRWQAEAEAAKKRQDAADEAARRAAQEREAREHQEREQKRREAAAAAQRVAREREALLEFEDAQRRHAQRTNRVVVGVILSVLVIIWLLTNNRSALDHVSATPTSIAVITSLQTPQALALGSPTGKPADTSTPTSTPIRTKKPTGVVTETRLPSLTSQMTNDLPRTIVSSNLRAGPGVNFPIVAVLDAGTEVLPIERTRDSGWYHIRGPKPNVEGWINVSTLSEVSLLDSVSIASNLPATPTQALPTTTPTPTAAPIPTLPGGAIVVACVPNGGIINIKNVKSWWVERFLGDQLPDAGNGDWGRHMPPTGRGIYWALDGSGPHVFCQGVDYGKQEP